MSFRFISKQVQPQFMGKLTASVHKALSDRLKANEPVVLLVRGSELQAFMSEIREKILQGLPVPCYFLTDLSQEPPKINTKTMMGLELCPEVKRDNLSSYWRELRALYGHSSCWSLYYADPSSLADYFFSAASEGMLVDEEGFYVNFDEIPFGFFHFFPREIRFRHPQLEDLPALIELEQHCWPAKIAMTESILRNRVSQNPEDHIVVEVEGEVVGVIYSQPIRNDADLFEQRGDTVQNLYDPSGKVIQLLALNIFPERQAAGLGDDLLEFMLLWRSLQPGIQKVVGVTRWAHYVHHLNQTPEAYLHLKNAEGDSYDPVTHMHEHHGAILKALVPNYRPADIDNLGYGVLVEYDLAQRLNILEKQSQKKEETISFKKDNLTKRDISYIVNHHILELLPPNKKADFIASAPLMGLGISSLELMELRDSLGQLFDVPLHATFFFQYGTAESIANYFIETILHRYYDWIYTLEFRALPAPMIEPLSVNGLWIIFTDKNNHLASALAEKLEAESQRVVKVSSESLEYFDQLSQENIEGIIYLYGVPDSVSCPLSDGIMKAEHRKSCEGLLLLVQTLRRRLAQKPTRLWIIHDSLQELEGEESFLEAPLIWLSGAVMTEHPELSCHRVMLMKNTSISENVLHCLEAFKSLNAEEQISWVKGTRRVPRLIRVKLPEKHESVVLDPKASYVIVGGCGGLGSLGLWVAEWHIAHGAQHLLLIDPLPISSFSTEFIQNLSEKVTSLNRITLNVMNKEALENALKMQNTLEGPIKGIMHVLGIMDEDKLINLTWQRFENVMQYKVPVSWYLHEISLELSLNLDHFILFSSIGSIMGPLWRSTRSAGNGFLGALSRYRRRQGLAALAIDWGPWGSGIPVGDPMFEINVPEGLNPISIKDGMELLTELYRSPLAEVVAADVDWSKFLKRFASIRPLFYDIQSELGMRQSEILLQLLNQSEEQGQEMVEHYFKQHLRRILFKPSHFAIDPEKTLTEIGVDDLRSDELKQNIQFDLGAKAILPAHLFLENISIKDIVKALFSSMKNIKIERRRTPVSIARAALNEPIAIIGMGCRFPGGVKNPEQLWEILKNGVDTITEVPADRWDIDAYYDSDKKAPGKMYTRFGGFIDHVDLFDPQFFSISPREAEDMDPQQRLSLEVAWEALENAGIPAHRLKGSKTGVFIGISYNDYGQLIRQSGDVAAVDNYFSTGNNYSVSAGRISYVFGLEGPAMAIDTACSSSLVSIDSAVKHLHLGECDLAIAGGVNLILAPELTINFCKSGMLSDDGRCKTFDEKADGYVRSEGCGLLVLKRLSDALKAKDRILALIRATSINQDGASTGLTVPKQKAQENVIRAALKEGGLKSSEIRYVEAHGTGTALGDPIEVRAISSTYGENRSPNNPLILGSLKTNIGHTEAAAGVAGLMKCVLALQNELIPSHLNFHRLNPYIEIDPDKIKIPRILTPWPKEKNLRYAAVSSFGFSGTNSHVILSEAPQLNESDPEKPPYILLISAKTKVALVQQEAQLIGFLEAHPKVNLSDVAYTLQVGRMHFSHRKVIAGDTREELLRSLLQPLPDRLQKAVEKWLEGEFVDWAKFNIDQTRHIITLPTYPFQRNRYWAKSANKTQEHSLHTSGISHPILSDQHYLPTHDVQLSGSVDLSRQALYQDHRVFGQIIFPGMGFVELMVAALHSIEAFSQHPFILENISIEKPLILSIQHPSFLSVLLSPLEDKKDSFQVRVDSELATKTNKMPHWINHANARLRLTEGSLDTLDLKNLKEKCPKRVVVSEAYRRSAQAGLQYGISFQGLKEIYVGEQEALGKIEYSNLDFEKNPYYLNPVVFDCALQLLMVLLQANKNELVATGVFLPLAFESISIYQTHFKSCWAYLQFQGISPLKMASATIVLFDDAGNILAECKGYQAKFIEEMAFQHLLDNEYAHEDLFYSLQWLDDTEIKKVAKVELRRAILVGNNYRFTESQFIGLIPKNWNMFRIATVSELNKYENITDVIFMSGIEDLLACIQSLTKESRQKPVHLWIITRGAESINNDVDPYQLPLIGLGRTLINEHPEFHCRLIDLDPNSDNPEKDLIHALENTNAENQIAYRNNRRLVLRLRARAMAEELLPAHYHLSIPQRGLTDNLIIKSKTLKPPLNNEVQIKVYASGLNFRDVLNVLDLYPGDPGPLGLECSGIITAVGKGISEFSLNDEVMALAWDSFSDAVNVNSNLVVKKPKTLSFEEAASIPLVFQTVYYGLIMLGKLKKGDKILIHAAAGGIGTAAIQVAKLVGAEIYATASTGKWDFLREKAITHLYNSRTIDFAEAILQETGGRGVDVVINALGGEFIDKTVSCLNKNARFIELGKRDIWSIEKMKKYRPDIDYHIVEIDKFMQKSPEKIREIWNGLEGLFETQKLLPLPVTHYSITDSVDAFRYMQAAKHIGKVVLTSRALSEQKPLFLENATYLVTAGLGSLGFELVQWLVLKGAKHLLLTLRQEPSTEQRIKLDKLQKLGINIYLRTVDVSIMAEIQDLIRFAKDHLPPLKGIFHTAGTVDDGIITQQTWERFQNVFLSKINGSWNLHMATREIPLDYFVLYSSIVSVLGLAGQSNYAAANAFMDGLSAHRQFHGLASISINWGPWGEVGMAVRQHMKIPGMRNLSLTQGLSSLNKLLRSKISQIVVAPVNWKDFLHAQPGDWQLLNDLDKGQEHEVLQEPRILLKNKLLAASQEERDVLLEEYLSKQVHRVLKLKKDHVLERDRGFFDFGMDSLMAVELKNFLQQDLGNEKLLMQTLIFNYPNLEKLKLYYQTQIFPELWESVVKTEKLSSMEKEKQKEENLLNEIEKMKPENIDEYLKKFE